MISRRKIFGWFSGLIGGAVAMPAVLRGENLGAYEPPSKYLAMWRPTDEQMRRYSRVCRHRDLLRPGVYRWMSEDKDVLGRTVDLEGPTGFGDTLLIRSYNGYDRKERWFHLKLDDLQTRRNEIMAEAKAAILPPKERIYLEQIRDQVLALAAPHIEKHAATIDFDAWVDHTTDNVLCKAYHSDEHYAAAFAITRKAVRDGTYLKDAESGWEALAALMTNKPIPAAYYVEQHPYRINTWKT